MRLITREDFIDIKSKLRQRGKGFLMSKINPNNESRTKSAFDVSAHQASNWWMIPRVRQRWNQLITGSNSLDYEDYMMNTHFSDSTELKMLSVGSGVCSHEIKLAKYDQFNEIICVDLVQSLLDKASQKAAEEGIQNMKFVCGDMSKVIPSEERFDIVFFHASLHHFYDIEKYIESTILPKLKQGGHIVINEYVGVNRLQYPSHQIKAINSALQLIPDHLKTRYLSDAKKSKYYGSGVIRMVIADPSECVDSEKILPTLRKYCEVIEEKPYGGNILMSALKDIAHNFVKSTEESSQVLQKLFDLEDEYLTNHQSDMYFGIYRKKNNGLF